MILMDSDSATAMCLGRTSLVGDKASEPLNGKSLDLVIR
jgi:Xaa-Pro dipeptidase